MVYYEFVVGHHLPYVHPASTRHHSRDRCSQAFPIFCTLPLPCIILNANLRMKNEVDLGTRLTLQHFKHFAPHPLGYPSGEAKFHCCKGSAYIDDLTISLVLTTFWEYRIAGNIGGH